DDDDAIELDRGRAGRAVLGVQAADAAEADDAQPDSLALCRRGADWQRSHPAPLLSRLRRRLREGRGAAEPRQLRVDEELHEFLEADRRPPAQPLARLRRVPDEVVELGLAAPQGLVDLDVLAP